MDLDLPAASIDEKIRTLHHGLLAEMPGIARLAIATYDPKTDLLKTFANSTFAGEALARHEAKLSDVPTLQALAKGRRDRVIDDTSIFENHETRHSQVVVANWKSSYTRPLFDGKRFRGFVFFDSKERGFFTPQVVLRVGVYAELMSLLLSSHLFPTQVLYSAVEAASEVSHARDPETGAHLDRMSRYARLIAVGMASQHNFSDAFIEHILLFAPLHDVGKVAIPDHILLKPGRLTDDEMAIMKTHSTRGANLVDRLLARLELPDPQAGVMLHNIIRHHHEAWNGKGYPDGLAGTKIPMEARIVTVADVYDALTSERPYKQPWSVDTTFQFLHDESGKLFDSECVAALRAARADAEEIRRTFVDTPEPLRLREGYSPDL